MTSIKEAATMLCGYLDAGHPDAIEFLSTTPFKVEDGICHYEVRKNITHQKATIEIPEKLNNSLQGWFKNGITKLIIKQKKIRNGILVTTWRGDIVFGQ